MSKYSESKSVILTQTHNENVILLCQYNSSNDDVDDDVDNNNISGVRCARISY